LELSGKNIGDGRQVLSAKNQVARYHSRVVGVFSNNHLNNNLIMETFIIQGNYHR